MYDQGFETYTVNGSAPLASADGSPFNDVMVITLNFECSNRVQVSVEPL